jgi:hypothetical protein
VAVHRIGHTLEVAGQDDGRQAAGGIVGGHELPVDQAAREDLGGVGRQGRERGDVGALAEIRQPQVGADRGIGRQPRRQTGRGIGRNQGGAGGPQVQVRAQRGKHAGHHPQIGQTPGGDREDQIRRHRRGSPLHRREHGCAGVAGGERTQPVGLLADLGWVAEGAGATLGEDDDLMVDGVVGFRQPIDDDALILARQRVGARRDGVAGHDEAQHARARHQQRGGPAQEALFQPAIFRVEVIRGVEPEQMHSWRGGGGGRRDLDPEEVGVGDAHGVGRGQGAGPELAGPAGTHGFQLVAMQLEVDARLRAGKGQPQAGLQQAQQGHAFPGTRIAREEGGGRLAGARLPGAPIETGCHRRQEFGGEGVVPGTSETGQTSHRSHLHRTRPGVCSAASGRMGRRKPGIRDPGRR